MRKDLLLHAIIVVMFLFFGCARSSEDPDAEEKEKKRLCGNGIVDEWEECDRISDISCGEIFPGMIGPLACNSCMIDDSKCIEQTVCDVEQCSNNGKCVEMDRFNYMPFCQCNYGSSGDDCLECAEERHYDIDGRCITDSYCTAVGCNERQTCEIIVQQAECICRYPYVGENCDDCSYGYEFVDGECVGVLCSTTDTECPEFEKCDDSSGEIVCVCETGKQDPDDCSKCLPGYQWVQQECTDKAWVMCKTDPSRPENSFDKTELVLITYTEENGWSEPEYCDWECMKNTVFENGKCRKMEIFYSNETDFPFGFDSSGRLITGNLQGGVLILTSTGIIKKSSYDIQFTSGRIGADGNLYFMTDHGYGVLNHGTGNYFIFQREMITSQLTLSRDGTVFYGDAYFDFPNLVHVSESLQDKKAVTVIDHKGNTLTVYQDGYAVLMDMDKSLVWSKQYYTYNFTLFPALGSNDMAYLPCLMKSQHKTSVLMIDLNDGEIIGNSELYSGLDLESAPSISLDSDYIKYVSDRGVLKVYESDNTFLYDTSSISPYRPDTESISPVLSDEGMIYFANDYQILALRESDKKKVWSFDLNWNAKPRAIIQKNGKLYVFTTKDELHIMNAPGEPAGKWPQMLHDSQLTGSMAYTPEFKRPVASTLSSPVNSTVFDKDTVTFSWQIDSGDPEIKYTLLLRDSTGYDKVYAGPETGLTTATIEGLADGTYKWRVVSQDSNGSLNVSAARSFTIQ